MIVFKFYKKAYFIAPKLTTLTSFAMSNEVVETQCLRLKYTILRLNITMLASKKKT